MQDVRDIPSKVKGRLLHHLLPACKKEAYHFLGLFRFCLQNIPHWGSQLEAIYEVTWKVSSFSRAQNKRGLCSRSSFQSKQLGSYEPADPRGARVPARKRGHMSSLSSPHGRTAVRTCRLLKGMLCHLLQRTIYYGKCSSWKPPRPEIAWVPHCRTSSDHVARRHHRELEVVNSPQVRRWGGPSNNIL